MLLQHVAASCRRAQSAHQSRPRQSEGIDSAIGSATACKQACTAVGGRAYQPHHDAPLCPVLCHLQSLQAAGLGRADALGCEGAQALCIAAVKGVHGRQSHDCEPVQQPLALHLRCLAQHIGLGHIGCSANA